MLINALMLPTRYKPGIRLNSIQRRNLVGNHTKLNVAVGSTFQVPHPNFRKVLLRERNGDIYVDRYFLGYQDKDKTFPQNLIPIYSKYHQKDEINVLMFLPGIKEALFQLTGWLPQPVPLKHILMDVIIGEVDASWPDLADILRSYKDDHIFDITINEDVSGYSGIEDTLNAGYPWDICNMFTEVLLVNMIQMQERSPAHIVGQLTDLMPIVQFWSAGNSPLHQALDDIFGVHVCPTYDNKIDPLTWHCAHEGVVPLSDVMKHYALRDVEPAPLISVDEEASVEKVTTFSTEILKLCVWMHRCPFTEISFKTILPNGKDPISIRLYSAKTLSPDGVDLALFQLELSDILQMWDGNKYKEIIITKTAYDELFLELIDHEGKNSRKFYIDLFYATLLSQSLAQDVNLLT